MLKLGILSDTHIPDRSPGLPPMVSEVFQSAGVAAILHAGDICIPSVLHQLERIAPVYAVRGNRDIYFLRHLPTRLALEFDGVRLGLIHGHGWLVNYLLDKAAMLVHGIQEEHYRKRVLRAFPQQDLVVFGHLHRRINAWVQDQLLFNPGSACCPDWSMGAGPGVGLISLDDGKITGVEFVDLDQG